MADRLACRLPCVPFVTAKEDTGIMNTRQPAHTGMSRRDTCRLGEYSRCLVQLREGPQPERLFRHLRRGPVRHVLGGQGLTDRLWSAAANTASMRCRANIRA